MMLYLVSNKIPDIYVSVNWCANFTHNTKVSHDIYVRRICQYLQGNMYKVILLNISKKMVVYCYLCADLWDCGDIKILKILYVLGVGLNLW